MFAKRSLSLTMPGVLQEPILRREDIADSLLARQVLEDAERQAHAMLARLQQEAEAAHQQALAQFWTTANGFLQSLEQQREALQRDAMAAVESLLTEALGRLLDETALPERVRALARNLAASQLNEAVAVLSCPAAMLDPLKQWLADSRFAGHWALRADASLAPQTLRLSDANGAFDIDWPTLQRGLLGADSLSSAL